MQLSTLELEAEISQVLADNPLLERDDEPVAPEAQAESERESSVQDDEPAAERDAPIEEMPGSGGVYPDEDGGPPEAAMPDTLREHLLGQLMLTRAARDAALAALLIDELDENGYLGSPLEEILGWLPAELEPDIDELKAALSLLQSFDPPGIGARDMAECLLLQLRHPDITRLPEAADPAALACAREICARHLPLLATGNVARLCAAAGCDETRFRAAHALILRLEPRPGRAWTVPAADYAVPDVIVRKTRRGWQVTLNSAAVPRLQINGLYAQMLGNQKESAHAGLQAQLQQAKWMIRNVEQRFDTILRCPRPSSSARRPFQPGAGGHATADPEGHRGRTGPARIHDFTGHDAEVHAHPVWHAGAQALLRGGVSTDGGDATSATAVQTHIRQMVADENRAKPLSDSQIMEKLADQGIVIARRTVAKYREALRIAPAALRKAQAFR